MEVTLGDGRSLKAIAEGTVRMETLLPDGNTHKCKLDDVLFIPELSYSLLSMSKTSEIGNTVKFSKSGCEILNKKKKVVVFVTKAGNLYYLEHYRKTQNVNLVEESKERLWHRRYGHLGENNLRVIANHKLVEQFDYSESGSIGLCESCIGGKQHRTPFDSSSRQTSDLLELVHSDVCGKISENSIGGALTFTDDKSRYSWVYIIKTKDQVFDCYLEWKALVEKATKRKVRTLRTDNGGEYTSTQFNNYLKAEGIRHELTIPKTPEQNGVAEQLNRTLMEMAHSMLLDAKLPKEFWAEAISTAVYLKNRSPTKALKLTPYEAWHGTKPKVNHLRVFGSDAYAHIPKDERSKFDSKTRKCIMVGSKTVTKGYRLFDMTRQKIVHSRDVHFYENVKNYQQSSTDSMADDYQLTAEFTNDDSNDQESQDTQPMPVEEQPEPSTTLRRSTRERRQPEYYHEHTSLCEVPLQPSSYQESIKGPDKAKWQVAMETEMKSLEENEVWDLVKLPADRKAVGSKWVTVY